MTFPILGVIFHDPDFLFHDGEHGNKLFVVLGLSPSKDYIVARTTSQPDRKSWIYGCHNDEPDANFFVPITLGIFPKDTWICLDYLADFDTQEFDKKVISSKIVRKGILPLSVIKDLLSCAANADDTSGKQSKVLLDTLAVI